MDNRREENGFNLFEKLPDMIKGISVIIGCIVIITGLVYVVSTIDHVFKVVNDPKVAEAAIISLNEIIKGDELLVTDNSFKITIGLGRPVSLAVYVLFLLFAGYLSLSLIVAGAKVIAWTTNEQGAIKKLIDGIFGEKKNSLPYTESVEYKEPDL